MKIFNSFITGFGSNLVILLAIILLPAFLVTDHVDAFDKIISYILDNESCL